MIPAYMITDRAITVSVDGRPHTVHAEDPQYEALKKALKEKNYDAIPSLLTITAAITEFSAGEVTVKDGEVFYRGYACNGTVVDKILELMKEGFDITPLTNFLARVENNPSIDARRELYDFCQANGFMIDEKGYIIAYKAVRSDYKDIHSGTMLNRVGDTPTMKREEVDPNRNQTCSRGLHFAAYEYAENFGHVRSGGGNRLMVVRVDPADVVAIPNDYNGQKGRAWKYTVIDEIKDGEPLKGKTFRASDFQVSPPVDLDDEGWDLDDEDWEEDWDDDDQPEDLSARAGDGQGDDVVGQTIVVFDDGMDKEEIVGALDECDWQVAGPDGAAEFLGIPESTLRGRMKRLGINRPTV